MARRINTVNEISKRNAKFNFNIRNSISTTDPDILKIDEPLMNLLCAYCVSNNSSIHNYGLSSIAKLFSVLPEEMYAYNQRVRVKSQFIRKILEDRLRGISDRDLLLSSADKVMDISSIVDDENLLREVNNNEVTYVESTVAMYHNNMYLNSHIGSMLNVLLAYKDADFRTRNSLLAGVHKTATDLVTQFRRNDTNRDSSDTLFRLSSMESSVKDIHKYVTSPSFKLVTGIQGLNAMFGGGLEKGNVYAFFGLPGEGKTVTLENMLYQIWKYNRGYQCTDKTKKPCIVLLTMENFVRQTVCALYHILTKGKNLKDCKTADEAIEEFKKHAFEFDEDNENSIEIIIKYKPVNSVTTEYLYKIVEDLEDEGFECIAFLQDYVKRIMPVNYTGDSFQDLGNVINDFKTFAMLKHLPFLTASQLNREAAKLIDEGRNANRNDLIKKLGRANIGESNRIDENLDCTIFIAPEIGANGKKYMGFKLSKHRYEIYTDKLSIYQPFISNDSIAMVEDIYDAKPAYRESLMRDTEEIRAAFGDIDRASINKTVTSIARLTNTMMNAPKQTAITSIIQLPHENREKAVPVSKIVKKEVMVFIPKEKREELREQLNIKKWV